MEKQKHCESILQHMKTFGSINPKEAENLYGCMRQDQGSAEPWRGH